MDSLSPYKLTIIAGVVILVLSVGIVIVLGGAQNAAPYIGLVGTIAVPGLLALFRLEQNAILTTDLHAENTQLHLTNLDAVHETNAKLDALSEALQQKGKTK